MPKISHSHKSIFIALLLSFGVSAQEPSGTVQLLKEQLKYDTLHISNGQYIHGESFDFNLNDPYYRFVGPGTDWYDDANWNLSVPSSDTNPKTIIIESDCIKADGIEIGGPDVFLVKNGVTFLVTPETLSQNDTSIYKPKGVYASSFGNESALNHSEVQGSLIRVRWKDLEPSEGNFDFSILENYLLAIKSRNLKWSLGVIAGESSPDWLVDSYGAGSFEISSYDNTTKRIPKAWDPKVNERFKILVEALSNAYADDQDLALIYIPQMTANGIEGHFNGVPTATLTAAGMTAENWIASVKETANIFANAFPSKALAVEVHDIMGETSIPNQIITDLWTDNSLNQRVGAAIWWISGKTSYQTSLLEALTNFPGDIYAQAIGRSDQTHRFENDDYNTLFSQAETMGVRYIELWEYEFVNDTYPEAFQRFNSYSDLTFEF